MHKNANKKRNTNSGKLYETVHKKTAAVYSENFRAKKTADGLRKMRRNAHIKKSMPEPHESVRKPREIIKKVQQKKSIEARAKLEESAICKHYNARDMPDLSGSKRVYEHDTRAGGQEPHGGRCKEFIDAITHVRPAAYLEILEALKRGGLPGEIQ